MKLDGNSTPPSADEIEVSLFGPGYGECILIHLGQNKWIVIDSCIIPGTKKCAALEYFSKLGVDPSNSVEMIIATHWHDDHLRGLSDVFKNSTRATFFCSDALRFDEFVTLVNAYKNRSMIESSGVDEFGKILAELSRRQKENKTNYIGPEFTAADRTLLRTKQIDSSGQSRTCIVYALSPSSASILKSKLHIANFLPKTKQPKNAIITYPPNHASIVLLITIDTTSILLGADLEEKNGNPIGEWSIILNSKIRPQQKSSLYKIAHHGSVNADHPGIWQIMLDKNPTAILTCFSKGPQKRPSKKDVVRICSNSSNTFSTSIPGDVKKLKRESVVEKTIKETVKNIKLINSSFGQVRCRKVASQNWTVDLFGDAVHLCKKYSLV